MIKTQKNITIFKAILIQTVLAVSIGLVALLIMTKGTIAPNVYVEKTDISGMDKVKAIQKIDDNFRDTIANGSLVIKYSNNKLFSIKYSDIDVSLDSDATARKALGANIDAYINLLKGYFTHEKNIIRPVITYNNGKLREKLNELAVLIDKDPVDATVVLVDGKIEKSAGANGLKLNLNNATTEVSDVISKNINSIIEFKPENEFEIEILPPKYTLNDFDGVVDVIAQYSTDIKSQQSEKSIMVAVQAINRYALFPPDEKRGHNVATFSFNECLKSENIVSKENDEGYNQVASTLYAALLNSEVLQSTITRTPHKTTVDYIEPGMDAIVLGDTYDLKFSNTLDGVLIVFAEIKDNKVIISLVGKKSNLKEKRIIEIEVKQRFDPTVVNTENDELKQGERKMISPGKQGIEVGVYRVTDVYSNESNRKLLYYDKYDAVKVVYEIGPGTIATDDTSK